MKFFEDKDMKKIIYLFISIIVITALIFVVIFLWYNKQLTQESELSILNMSYANNINDNTTSFNTAQASFSEDKDVKNSVSNTNNSVNIANVTNNKNQVSNSEKKETDKTETENSAKTSNSVEETEFEGDEIEVQEYKLEFEAPVSGDITKDFAEENLVYSKTLDEWTTHLGIDIRAEKTCVVKSSEKGIIESIKNDPRYGLTIIISHQEGYKTVYANLLSTEFVAVGDEVEKGQTIGTVGQSSSFESADDAHLHFEMYKEGENVNPTIYLK